MRYRYRGYQLLLASLFLGVATVGTPIQVLLPDGVKRAAVPPYYSDGNEAPPARVAPSAYLRFQDRAYILEPVIWHLTRLPVCWEDEGISEADRSLVADAVNQSWAANSNITFGWSKGVCDTSAGFIRIHVIDDENQAPRTRGGESGLGKDLDGHSSNLILNLTFKHWSVACSNDESARRACIKAIAVHEFGHVLGFAHEQNRPDAPGECAQKRQGASGNVLDLTPYDRDSAMNYCNDRYLNGGELSECDKKALQAFYGKPAGSATPNCPVAKGIAS